MKKDVDNFKKYIKKNVICVYLHASMLVIFQFTD